MKNSISNKTLDIFGILFWILVWQILSMAINEEILLVSPCVVFKTLLEIISEKEFWIRISTSFLKITAGFFLGAVCGSVLGALSEINRLVNAIAKPINQVIKSTPVASFIILILFWIKSANISVVISFLIVFPVFFLNIFQGMKNLDLKMKQMADVYHMSFKNRFLYVNMPQIMPYLISACSMGMGMCWKAGIAAEVIATPKNSIGDILYRSKINMDSAMLFAWTAAVVILSIVFEKFFLWVLNKISGRFYQNGEEK